MNSRLRLKNLVIVLSVLSFSVPVSASMTASDRPLEVSLGFTEIQLSRNVADILAAAEKSRQNQTPLKFSDPKPLQMDITAENLSHAIDWTGWSRSSYLPREFMDASVFDSKFVMPTWSNPEWVGDASNHAPGFGPNFKKFRSNGSDSYGMGALSL